MENVYLRAALLMSLMTAIPVTGRPQAAQSNPVQVSPPPSSDVSYPTHGEIVAAISTAARVYSEFDQVTDQIDFSNWNASYGDQRNARVALDSTRNRLAHDRAVLSSLQSSPTATASQLFVVLTDVNDLGQLAGSLATGVAHFSSELDLASNLLKTATDAENAATVLTTLFEKQLSMEERQLVTEWIALQACRAQAH